MVAMSERPLRHCRFPSQLAASLLPARRERNRGRFGIGALHVCDPCRNIGSNRLKQRRETEKARWIHRLPPCRREPHSAAPATPIAAVLLFQLLQAQRDSHILNRSGALHGGLSSDTIGACHNPFGMANPLCRFRDLGGFVRGVTFQFAFRSVGTAAPRTRAKRVSGWTGSSLPLQATWPSGLIRTKCSS